jgi:DNA end-binding protein Ku
MAATVWKGFVTFGLISIPVRLTRAARPERVHLRRLKRRELEPAHETSTKDGVKGYEYRKGEFVKIEKEELKAIEPKTTTEMAIQECVALDEIDPVYFETSYYVAPEEAGGKAYGLLYRSLQAMKLVALAQFAMHSREHVVVLRPGKKGLLAHTMFYPAEVRADQEFKANTHAVSDKELELAKTLVRSLEAPFKPEKYHDTYREKLEAILADKAKGKHVKVAAGEPRPQPSKVVDIADALRKSLAGLKKPAERQPARKTRKAAGH